MLTLVTGLVNAGVPIDGVGLQGHLIVGSTPGLDTLKNVLSSFTALGLEVAYTELGQPFFNLFVLLTYPIRRHPTDTPCH